MQSAVLFIELLSKRSPVSPGTPQRPNFLVGLQLCFSLADDKVAVMQWGQMAYDVPQFSATRVLGSYRGAAMTLHLFLVRGGTTLRTRCRGYLYCTVRIVVQDREA